MECTGLTLLKAASSACFISSCEQLAADGDTLAWRKQVLQRSNKSQISSLCRGREALISIVTALCNLHGNSFAHFDLKTPNVLIASDGSVKVADVGLGKLVMGSQDIKLSHSGTFVWAAPEQLDLHGSKGSFASDMFALSTIIHEVTLLSLCDVNLLLPLRQCVKPSFAS